MGKPSADPPVTGLGGSPLGSGAQQRGWCCDASCDDLPDVVVEIDSAPNAESMRKLEFARDAGALPIWVRHGSGRITEPEGIGVIDVRPSIAAAAQAAQAARDQETEAAPEQNEPAGQADAAPARLEATRETAIWLDAQIKALGDLPFRVNLGIDGGRWDWRCGRPGCQGGHYVSPP